MKGENRTPEFLQINPMGTLPVMTEGDFKLFESHAILRYLAETKGASPDWYPKNPQKRAIVDQYLDWHHTFLRQGATGLVYRKYWAPKYYGKIYTKEELSFYEVYLKRSLIMMERWLTTNEFLCGP